eukprot:CAMPEP_0197845506 /NCGR_PEP_ID=MMETSP1438-20131217/2426_1 /TAXON_ID=1461541 /ORGANISM="Pterosperma sp., Strain CCMP1384" /LENGTH=314 /DNA_ID=CAMNT_0043456825 /DNA_START=345 /DNA_END=1289 /DNA_ORIENTATION=+
MTRCVAPGAKLSAVVRPACSGRSTGTSAARSLFSLRQQSVQNFGPLGASKQARYIGSRRHWRHVVWSGENGDDGSPETPQKKHSVIERIEVFRMKDDATAEAMQDMMDNLYTMQYSFNGILCCSVGEVLDQGPRGYTHAMHLRFPDMACLDRFLLHPIHYTISEKYVKPIVEDSLVLNFEGNVDDDVFAIFRRGDMWAEGVEHIVLYTMKDDVDPKEADAVVGELSNLPASLDSKAVLQITGGRILSGVSGNFTHGVLSRIPGRVDSGALQIYNMDPDRQAVLSRIGAIKEDSMAIDYEITAVEQKNNSNFRGN